ncbi:efflux RND transporter periplasmic adaptor subunit [Alkalitalea saponilacus]|uniref:RND family efflux transporter, MFP subunit n=1 Tax=Alkalitalea saponilacus TaxID=889453 RepID=A0A1T5HSC6_9BACT|nr:efflux RND transporter periplasmic adaptor subunit [Alkalitalea saponilacus]ASB48362.1 RND transporter [Alkalitalea saponilacus]SKC23593.1 RND family efflux transporter, MFP subunit [Alkalitalea saponilacus]
MKKNIWQLIAPLGLVVVTLVVYALATRESDREPDVVRVEKGTFEVVVSASGELEALEYEQITIPDVLLDRTIRVRHIQITDMIREGTVVSRGDYVATLDPGEVEDRLRQAQDRLEMYLNNLENNRIDSSLVLSDARDAIRQARDQVLDMEIRLEQSAFESEAVQRQAQISLERAERDYQQRHRNYTQTRRRLELRIRRAMDNVKETENEIQVIEQLKQDLRITAPADGMVVYARGNDGQKIRVGSHVSRWNPLIATLPDLSTIQSVVDVKEIDIAKIRPGLPVRVRIDAFPDERFTGVVKRVANIGQEQSNDFFNVFRVEIEVNPEGRTLLPGMTSSNNIVVESVRDAIIVPRLAVFTGSDNIRYVFKREGLSVVKQQIRTSGENDNFFKVVDGIEEGDRVMLTPPSNAETLKLVSL